MERNGLFFISLNINIKTLIYALSKVSLDCLRLADEVGYREALNRVCAAREVVLGTGSEGDSNKKAAKKAALNEKVVCRF